MYNHLFSQHKRIIGIKNQVESKLISLARQQQDIYNEECQDANNRWNTADYFEVCEHINTIECWYYAEDNFFTTTNLDQCILDGNPETYRLKCNLEAATLEFRQHQAKIVANDKLITELEAQLVKLKGSK